MAGKCLLGLLLMSFLTAPSFSQDTIYIDRKNKWLESKERAVRYCVRTYLKKDSIEVRYYNLGDTLLLIHHFSKFTSDPKQCKLNGQSAIYYANGQPSDTRMYVDGKRNGEYLRFYRDGKLKYRCTFINNAREGLVEMFYPDGSIWRTEQFRKGRSKGGHLYDEEGHEVDFYPSERSAAMLPAEYGDLQNFIREHIHYPKEAIAQNAEGRIFVQLAIDESGHVIKYRIHPKSNENYYLRKEVSRFAEEDLMEIKWIPAVKFGEFDKSILTVPVTFNIPKPKALKQ